MIITINYKRIHARLEIGSERVRISELLAAPSHMKNKTPYF